MKIHCETPYPGIRKLTFGEPESCVPSAQPYRKAPLAEAIAALPEPETAPFPPEEIRFTVSPRGCRLELPLRPGEDLYGFGLQLKSLRQTGKKRTLRVNSDPVADTGDSHAPAPLYFSTAGYGVLLDTARYATFYTGGNTPFSRREAAAPAGDIKLTEAELYAASGATAPVVAEIPVARGVTLYLFSGPTLLDAVRRYVLFCGGGCLLPEWSLGNWYRACGTATETEVAALARELREAEIPCDVLGLEPGWQSHAYSCSLRWSEERFPHHRELVESLRNSGFRINLWEHAFLHSTSPLYEPMADYAGEFEVWQGEVPDFTIPEAAKLFRDYHAKELTRQGISSFKLDECDNSDFIRSPWSFPECSRFPSGCDGEQMHSFFGLLYQQTILDACRDAGIRTCGSVRNSHAFAPPMPFVLYSDLYDHRDFLRGVAGCGFSGMLWTPELRHAQSPRDYLRRLQSMVLAPQMLMNIWSMPHPPWRQLVRERNLAGEFLPEAEQLRLKTLTRKILELRMGFLPLLYAAFADYRFRGIPPFRALAMEWPEDPRLREVDQAWMAGENLLCIPFTADEEERTVPLPEGGWRDYYTGELYRDEVTLRPDEETLPILVRENSIIPVARPVSHVADGMVYELVLRLYGETPRPARLYADDGWSFEWEKNPEHWGEVRADGTASASLSGRYRIDAVAQIGR